MKKTNQEIELKKSLFKIRFLGGGIYEDKFYRQIFRVTFCGWDDAPYLFVLTILGITLEFEIGKWVEDDL